MVETSCQVIFDNTSGIYYTGQTISGRVVLNLLKEKKVRGVYLSVIGTAKVRWTEHHTTRVGKKSVRRAVQYTSEISYLDSTTQVVSPQGEDDSSMMAPGTHTYNFVCVLPVGLPTSFEGKHGHIRYLVRLKMDRPWKFDHVFKTPFTVLRNIDLNQNLALREPIHRESIHRFAKCCCCFCCTHLPIKINIDIPQSGYAPGQEIIFNGLVDNKSPFEINQIKIKLIKMVTYTSQSPQFKEKSNTDQVAKKYIMGESGKKLESFSDSIRVPSLPPSDFISCSVIRYGYQLQFEFDIDGCCREHPEITIPIIIGTIPLYRIGGADPNVVVSTQPAPSAPATMSVDTPPPYPNMDPPSYEEAVGGRTDIQEEGEQTPGNHPSQPFAPFYPVYQYSSQNQMGGNSETNTASNQTKNIGWSISQ